MAFLSLKILPLFGALVASLVLPSAAVWAQDIKERTLKFSFGQPLEHPMGQGAQKFADLAAKKSGGKLKVNLFPNAVLGGDNQNLAGLRGGTIDLTTTVTGGVVGIVKDYMIFDFPFMFNNEEEAFALADGPIGKALADKLPEKGMVSLGIWDLGFRNLTNSRRPIAKMDDLAGLKLRALQVPIYLDVFRTLGANPVPLAFPELYSAMEARAVDGQENPLSLILTNKFYEVQKYLTLSRHTYSGMLILLSKKVWDDMSPAERTIISDSAREAGMEERVISLRQNRLAVDELKKHMQVTEMAPAEVQRLREAVRPVVNKYAHEVGDDFAKAVFAELERIRKNAPAK